MPRGPKRSSRWLSNGFVLRLVALALRAHARSLRLTVENEGPLRAHLAAGGRIIFASWHQRFYSGICYFSRYAPVIMISESRDGEMIARLAEHLGWRTIRGSSSHGGRAALAAMVAKLDEGPVAGHIVDGPRGPARKIKPGIAVLAQRANARIVPVYVAYARAWQARSWDQFEVPRPFSSVLIRFGRLIEIPAAISGDEMTGWCAALDEEFTGEYARAVADVGG